MRKFFVLVLAATLALTMTAGVAQAKGKGSGKGPKPDKPVTYTFTGTIASVDGATGELKVDVAEANNVASSFEGKEGVTFYETAETKKIVLNDEPAALTDLQAGDSLTVQARAPKGVTYSPTTNFTARIIDAKTPAVVSEPVATEPSV